jgi:CheY-like chemotaxis protein
MALFMRIQNHSDKQTKFIMHRERILIPSLFWGDVMEKAKILIVEDDKSNAELMKLLMFQNGYGICDVVATGEDAVDVAQKIHPDLILMDISLQGSIDGIMACEMIRKTNYIPLIYVSAYGDTDIHSKAMATKPNAFIEKPFKSKLLIEAVEMALSGNRQLAM